MSWIMSHSVSLLMWLKSEQNRCSHRTPFTDTKAKPWLYRQSDVLQTRYEPHYFVSCSDLIWKCFSDTSLVITFCKYFSMVLRWVLKTCLAYSGYRLPAIKFVLVLCYFYALTLFVLWAASKSKVEYIVHFRHFGTPLCYTLRSEHT